MDILYIIGWIVFILPYVILCILDNNYILTSFVCVLLISFFCIASPIVFIIFIVLSICMLVKFIKILLWKPKETDWSKIKVNATQEKWIKKTEEQFHIDRKYIDKSDFEYWGKMDTRNVGIEVIIFGMIFDLKYRVRYNKVGEKENV